MLKCLLQQPGGRATHVSTGRSTERMCPKEARASRSRRQASASRGGDSSSPSSPPAPPPSAHDTVSYFSADCTPPHRYRLLYAPPPPYPRTPARPRTHLHVVQQRGDYLVHVLRLPYVLHQVVRHRLPDDALEAQRDTQPRINWQHDVDCRPGCVPAGPVSRLGGSGPGGPAPRGCCGTWR